MANNLIAWTWFRHMVHAGATVLVGQAPNGSTDGPSRPLTGTSGRRIAELAGLGYPHEYVRRFGRINLIETFPGYRENGNGDGEGDAFPIVEARAGARRIVEEVVRGGGGNELVLLGRGVTRAFRWEPSSWFEETELAVLAKVDGSPTTHSLRLSVAPHPSGLNRYWNEEENRRLASEFFRERAERSLRCIAMKRETRS
jgi:hypothetical protein